MRYTLRNQNKIKAHFEPNGEEILNRITGSLDNFFSSVTDKSKDGMRCIYETFYKDGGDPYPVIAVNDIKDPDRMIEFYVIGQTYDVFNLAFKGFIKG